MKVTLHVALGSNEQAVVEVPMKDVQEWDARVRPALDKLGERVGQRARLIMQGNRQMQALRAENPELANTVHNIILVCLGQMPEVFTEGMVSKDWEAPEQAQLRRAEG